MNASGSILLKTLAAGAVTAGVVYAIFYGFFISHTELGIETSVAGWLALSAFFLMAVIAWIYLQLKIKR